MDLNITSLTLMIVGIEDTLQGSPRYGFASDFQLNGSGPEIICYRLVVGKKVRVAD